MPHAVRSAIALAALATPCFATIVKEAVPSEHLVGHIISVSLIVRTGPSSYWVIPEDAVIQQGAPGTLVAGKSGSWELPDVGMVPFSYTLEIVGDELSTAVWSLTNISMAGQAFPSSATLYPRQHNLRVVMDDDSFPSTPGSGEGASMAETVAGLPVFATFFDPNYLWNDPINAGDLDTSAQVQWTEIPNFTAFAPGMTCSWRWDADLVPAPGGMLALASLGALTTRRRR